MNQLATLCGLLFLVSSCAIATTQTKTTDISGHYRCQGEDFLNKGTFDEQTVVMKTGGTYHFLWQNKSLMIHGNGILLDNQVAIIYWIPVHPSVPGAVDTGVVNYKVLPNGDLKGRWTTKDGQITGAEYCSKIDETVTKKRRTLNLHLRTTVF